MPRRKDFVAVLMAGCSVAAGLALPPFTHAQGADATPLGFYVGGGASYSNVSVERPGSCYGDCYSWWGDYPTYDEGDGDYSFVGHVGYRVGRYFAVELGYVDAGTIGWDKDHVWMPDLGGYYRNEVDVEATAPELSAVGILPFLQRWEVYGRFGAGFWSGDSEQSLTDADTGDVVHRHDSDDGVGIVVGLGLGFSITPALHTRFEYQALWIDGDALNVDSETTLDTFSLELQYRFGALSATPASSPAEPTTGER